LEANDGFRLGFRHAVLLGHTDFPLQSRERFIANGPLEH